MSRACAQNASNTPSLNVVRVAGVGLQATQARPGALGQPPKSPT